MKACRNGVISMPVKLLVSFLIISLMVPTVLSTMENIRDDVYEREMTDAAEDLRTQLSKVSSRSSNFILQIELEVPEGGHMVIGDGTGRLISVYRNDTHIRDILTDFTVTGGPMILYGSMLLQLSNGPDGVTVKEL